MQKPKIYLAGPDVFLPDALAFAQRKKDIMAEYGFEGLHPFDNNVLPDIALDKQAKIIKDKNCEMMREADAILANLTPFRGPSADVGTAYEIGFMDALNKPIYAYTTVAGDYITRTKALYTLRKDGADWRDQDGMLVEEFGLFDNLMLGCALTRSLSVSQANPPDMFTDLEAFRAAVRIMQDDLENLH